MTVEATIEKPALFDINETLRSPVVRMCIRDIALQLKMRMAENALNRAQSRKEKMQFLAAYLSG